METQEMIGYEALGIIISIITGVLAVYVFIKRKLEGVKTDIIANHNDTFTKIEKQISALVDNVSLITQGQLISTNDIKKLGRALRRMEKQIRELYCRVDKLEDKVK